MDAPWRVIDAGTPIPITIVLKDCDVDDVRQLHWIRCWEESGAGDMLLWDHDFQDECIGDDPPERDFWTWITEVTEGHASLPDGTPLTPANLGHAAGEVIRLRVSIYYRDDWFNYTETRRLRVRVGGGPFPWPAGWYGGDSHCHAMYTNNIAEFGAPLPAVRLAARAAGLHWLTITDHSCDLDETGDGPYSYATHEWEYTHQTAAGIQTFVRDVFAAGSSWEGSGVEAAELDDPSFRLHRGVELNVASIDADSYEKTLHALIYAAGYIDSPNSGAFGERPVTPALPAGLAQVQGTAFAVAAHPLSDLGAEWGGVDWGVNGALWGDEDIDLALACDAFLGLEAFNTRETRRSSDTDDPWVDFAAGELPAIPYPQELLAGIALWDACLRANLTAGPGGSSRRVLLTGGSDAHGDFNYATYFGLDNYATDNAIGKVQTVVYVPGLLEPDALPPMGEILAGLRAGRAVVTDGPFLEIGVDRDASGDWYGAADVMIGGAAVLDPASTEIGVRWASLPEFGPVVSIRVLTGNATATTVLVAWDPSQSGEGWAGGTVLPLDAFALDGSSYLRAELTTDDGTAGHRAYTNPIWIDFDPLASVPDYGPDLRITAAVDPVLFRDRTRVRWGLARPGLVRVLVLDSTGRLVRRLEDESSSGSGDILWDGCDLTGAPVPAGVYTIDLRASGERRVLRAVRVR